MTFLKKLGFGILAVVGGVVAVAVDSLAGIIKSPCINEKQGVRHSVAPPDRQKKTLAESRFVRNVQGGFFFVRSIRQKPYALPCMELFICSSRGVRHSVVPPFLCRFAAFKKSLACLLDKPHYICYIIRAFFDNLDGTVHRISTTYPFGAMICNQQVGGSNPSASSIL